MAQNPFAPSLLSLADYREITRHVTDTGMRKNNAKKVYLTSAGEMRFKSTFSKSDTLKTTSANPPPPVLLQF